MKLMQICGLTPITLALAGEGWSMTCKLWHSVWSEAAGSQPGILSTRSNKASHNSCSGAAAHRLWTWRCSRGRSRRARPSPSGPRTLCLALSRPPSWTLCHVHRRQTMFDGLLKWQEQWQQPVQYCPSFQKLCAGSALLGRPTVVTKCSRLQDASLALELPLLHLPPPGQPRSLQNYPPHCRQSPGFQELPQESVSSGCWESWA